MNGVQFNYSSLRARQARLAHHIAHKEIHLLSLAGGLVLFAAGLLMALVLAVPFGWLLAGFSGPFFMAAVWSRMLMDIPPGSGSTSVDDILDADVLGVLPPSPSPQQLAAIVSGLVGGRFFGLRFGLGREFLAAVTSANAADSGKVWEEARRLQASAHEPTISAAALAAALIRTAPSADQILPRVRLSADDITAGYEWYNQLKAAAATTVRPRDGGIGRDWAFGFTPLLERFGFNMSQHPSAVATRHENLASRRAVFDQLLRLLSQPGHTNAALVGGLGSGKTTIVQLLAKKLIDADPSVPAGLRYWQIVALDPSTLISQSKERGELEQLVQHLLYEGAHAKNTILFLDDAQLFFEEGAGAVDLSHVLLPVLEAGALPLIMAMDEQRWLKISQSNPALVQHLNRIVVSPMDQRETMLVMQNQFFIYEYQQKVTYTYPAMQAAYELSSRYLSEQVMPGRALKLLEAGGQFAEQGLVTRGSVERAIEQTQGVKVGTADSGEERQKLLNLEQLIHERMINQVRAVQVVSDALRRARAGVRNQNRPIGTFLFLGPTGVGKTELAKSVAAVFFEGEDNLVRLDLNEYVRPEDVSRLIADGAQDPHSLTAQIGKRPFSVVLLDEIEKAHPNVLNTLLQMLDEGIMRDINNREVSFRDAVVVATSNAGAEQIRQHIESGQELEQFEEQFVNELINANVFRPEFLNRFDEIVLFRPLKPEELIKVIDIILRGINQTLTSQKVSVSVTDEAKRLLVEHSYDPRLGARPLRRVVQRVVENIASNQLLSGQAAPGSQIQIDAAQVQAMLERHE